MTQPDQYLIDKALEVAAWSPCKKSRRGVVIWDPANGAHRGSGFNGPPIGFVCPGREACRGTCALRCVHAAMRALDEAAAHRALANQCHDRGVPYFHKQEFVAGRLRHEVEHFSPPRNRQEFPHG